MDPSLTVHDIAATMPETYNYEYFNVTFPEQWVAQVEINRPEKMNAFIEK